MRLTNKIELKKQPLKENGYPDRFMEKNWIEKK